ncbi:MAG: cell division suppressor protein YneA [bacterium]
MYSKVQNSYRKEENKSSKNINVIMVFTFIIIIILFIGINTQSSESLEYTIITVEKGETLWSIVKTYNLVENQDPRAIICQIKNINNLNDVVLQPGQNLKVPKN